MDKPALYTRTNDLQRRDVRDFCDEFTDEISGMSGRCLDIGSGPGDTAVDLFLPTLNTKTILVCSDISENMVNFGKEKYKDNKRVAFVKLNIESTDLDREEEEPFDHVTSFNCLHWCQDLRQVFENIFSLLRPKGTSLLIFLANAPVFNAYPVLAAMPLYQAYMKDAARYIPFFQHSQQPRKILQALIEAAGFEVDHCSVREKSYTFESPNILSEFMLAINPFIHRMPADLREKYRNNLLSEVTKQNIIINQNVKNEDEYSVLCIYSIFVVKLRKPSIHSY